MKKNNNWVSLPLGFAEEHKAGWSWRPSCTSSSSGCTRSGSTWMRGSTSSLTHTSGTGWTCDTWRGTRVNLDQSQDSVTTESTRASCRNDGSDRPSAAHERAPKIWRTGPRLPLFIIKLTATSKSDEMSMSNNQTDDLTSSWFVSCFPGLLSQEDARPWKVWKEERDIIKLLLFLVTKVDSISRLWIW